MAMRNYRFTRREIREGSGSEEGIATEHFDEMIGSIEFFVYRHPNRKMKGYEALKLHLESQGCEVIHTTDTPTPIGNRFETLRITNKGGQIPTPLLKRAHNWAHQRDLLHMFYKKG